ncbi:MAG TPA: DUF1992 domain-containing protein [Thermomicrobiaceae bacterium]|nr:DUF1992 domain-containing protein [Thermomicrobiaceae bacterium]
MWWWDSLIDDKVRTAQQEGQFDNLRGAGRPFRWKDDSNDEDWLGNHLLHNAGVLPEWLQLRKEIAAERPAVREALDTYWLRRAELDPQDHRHAALLARLEAEYAARAREINRKIDEHNLRCPSLAHEMPRFPEDLIRRRLQRVCRS